MDWARARLLLLLTFTIVNIALLDRVWRPGGPGPVSDIGLAAFELREVRTRLGHQGFDLITQIPERGKVVPFLRMVAPARAVQRWISARISGLRTVPPATPGTTPVADTEEVYTLESGAVVFRPWLPWGQEAVRLDNRTAVRQAADEFLRRTRLAEVADLRWSRIAPVDANRVQAEYTLFHGGYPVYAGYVHILLGRNGVEEAIAFLPAAGEFRGEPKGVLSGAQALLRLAGHLSVGHTGAGKGEGDRAFTDLELGYYAPYPGTGAPSWEVVPVWRVTVDGRDHYYVNALTGELEPQ